MPRGAAGADAPGPGTDGAGVAASRAITRVAHISEIPTSPAVASLIEGAIKAEMFAGFREARLGKSVGLTQFGVNMVTLEPGSISSLRHWHEAEDEFVLVLTGEVTLIDENGEHALRAGHLAGFPAGAANGHHLLNRSAASATCLVVGARRPGAETIHYPDDDLGPIRK